jgi:SNF2 family DNA or RNA helicase
MQEDLFRQSISSPGGPAEPARAAARPWAPPGAAGPILIDFSKPAGAFHLSILEGGLLKVVVSPPNPEAYIELSKLPTRQQRAGVFGAAFWDLSGILSIASSMRHEVVIDPPVQAMIDRWNKRCLELEYVKNFAEFPDFHVPGLDIDFLDFQARGVNYFVMQRSGLLGDQMGTGKSIQSLGILFTHRQALGGRIETLILAPTSVVGDWHAKFRRFAKTEIAVADGTPARRHKIYESKPEFLALSYDTFIRDAAEIVQHFRPQAILADECQRFTNRKSKAAKTIHDFVDIALPKFRIPISGSPVANRPDDLWPILRLINPDLAGFATAFENRYLVKKPIYGYDHKTGKLGPKTYPGGKAPIMKVEGYQNLDELRMKIAPHMIRRLKKDVLKNLKEKWFERVEITLSAKERKVYEDLQARFAEFMAGVNSDDGDEEQIDNYLEFFTEAQQICSSLAIVGKGDQSSKMDELREFVSEYADDQKILIFSRFKEMTKIVTHELKSYHPLHLNGDIPQSKRQPLVDAFQDKEEHRLFVSTLKAGGVGLTLTAGTIVIRLDRWVSPAANEQAVDRAHRIGQGKQVTVVDFIVKDSIEERILEILNKKQKMINSLMSSDDDEETQERKIIRSLRRGELLNLI